MTLTNNYSFSYSGFVFGGAGSSYQIQSVDGLEGLPQIRNQDDNRGYADGMFTGRDFLAGRTISIILTVLGDSTNSAQTNFNLLQGYLIMQTSGTTPLYFYLSGAESEQMVNARVRGLRSTIDPNYTYGYIVAQVEFFCPDPRILSSTTQTASLTSASSLGRTYNRTYDLVYATSISNAVICNNAGTWYAYPVITITGPITSPSITNNTQSKTLSFTGTYTALDSLVIDTYNKLITLNGVSARNLLVSGDWFSLSQGDNSLTFSGTAAVIGTTQASVVWQSAYI